MRLQAILIPVEPRSSLNVGVISGGTTINTIAAEAYLELDLRSEDEDTLVGMAAQVRAIADQAEKPEPSRIKVDLELVGERAAGSIPAMHPLVQLASRVLEAYGIQPSLQIGSTDANIPLSLGYPSICVGITNGGGAHTTSEYILTSPVVQGLAQLIDLVEGIFAQS
jgi:di/tripeptidase